MNNKNKFLELIDPETSEFQIENEFRVNQREMLIHSQQIAMMVLQKLKDLQWTQKELAFKLGVSPQQVSKIVSGKENMTLETIVKLQQVLNISILVPYFKKSIDCKKENKKNLNSGLQYSNDTKSIQNME
jgi:transcriptional regulator with XRE-family HTH domain